MVPAGQGVIHTESSLTEYQDDTTSLELPSFTSSTLDRISEEKDQDDPRSHIEEKQPDDDHDHSAHEHSLLITESCIFMMARNTPRLAKSHRIRNIPPMAIGFIDLANSGDFAANVFNQVPVPIYAIVLMVFGATCALLMSYIAFTDARRSLRNIRLLREERTMLLSEASENCTPSHFCVTKLDLNHRDLWVEIFDRGGMEIMMGFAAFLIAVGTYMAPAGANPRIYRASNLLSGYIGNAPAAAYGLITVAWSIYVWIRAHHHNQAAEAGLEVGNVLQDLKSRTKTVQLHALLTGLSCVVSGVMGMFTPRHWWPYPVLAVCGVAFVYATWLYRERIGYERPQILVGVEVDKATLIHALASVDTTRQAMKTFVARGAEKSFLDSASLSTLLDLIMRCDLLQHYTQELVKDRDLSTLLFEGHGNEVVITSTSLNDLSAQHHPRLREMAKDCLEDRGLRQLSYRKQFLLEALGSSLAASVYTSSSFSRIRNK